MFFTDKFAYIGMPKTASTHIYRLLRKLVPGIENDKHAEVRQEDIIDGRRFLDRYARRGSTMFRCGLSDAQVWEAFAGQSIHNHIVQSSMAILLIRSGLNGG